MPTTVRKKSTTKTAVSKKSATKAAADKKSAAHLNGQPAGRKPKNRFIGATEAETDQRVREFNSFLGTLSDEDIDRELDKLSRSELHLLAWITTYNKHNKLWK